MTTIVYDHANRIIATDGRLTKDGAFVLIPVGGRE